MFICSLSEYHSVFPVNVYQTVYFHLLILDLILLLELDSISFGIHRQEFFSCSVLIATILDIVVKSLFIIMKNCFV